MASIGDRPTSRNRVTKLQLLRICVFVSRRSNFLASVGSWDSQKCSRWSDSISWANFLGRAVGGSIVRRMVGLIPFWIQSFSNYCCGGFCRTLQPTNPSPNMLLWHGPNHAYHVGLRAAIAEIAALRPPQRTSVRGSAGPGIFLSDYAGLEPNSHR